MKRLVWWCVQHRDGWCAVKDDEEPDAGAWHVPTTCDHVVMLPLSVVERAPTCGECRTVLGLTAEEQPNNVT